MLVASLWITRNGSLAELCAVAFTTRSLLLAFEVFWEALRFIVLCITLVKTPFC